MGKLFVIFSIVRVRVVSEPEGGQITVQHIREYTKFIATGDPLQVIKLLSKLPN